MRLVLTLLSTAAVLLFSQSRGVRTDWPSFGRDPGAARYSPLKQINAHNVGRLRHAWTFHTGKPGSEAVPVVVGGVMYTAAANGVFALQPETGKKIWHYPAEEVALRGLAYWPGDARTHPRLFVGAKGRLLALDALTGQPATGFGDEGSIDLRYGVLGDLPDARISLQSPPLVYKNLVVTGSTNGEGSPTQGAYGDIRAWDAYTGKLVWSFHTVPRPGEAGVETWPEGAWVNRSGANAWGFLTVDEDRGIVFAPLGSPTSDFYGADRHGDGLYGNSLVALDAGTGKLRWHRQLVHHDLWDFDPAAAPILFEAKVGGRAIPAVAQITKQSLLFVFDRTTGKPVYGMEERAVRQSRVPGEKTSPTQPFPLAPPPLARTAFAREDMYDLTPEHASFCRDLYERNRMRPAPLYTPLGLEGNTLMFPSTLGGGGWGGLSFDPSLGYLFTNVNHVGQWGHMEKKADPGTGEQTYVRTSEYGAYARFWNRETRIPCSKPPFGELVAIDTRTGSIAWRTALGTIPALDAAGVHGTGTLNLGGSIATAGGLVFIAATNDARFRAFEAKTGGLLWEHPIDANGHTIPITYLGRDGRQYIALMAGGGGGYLGGVASDSLMAFALGDGRTSIAAAKQEPEPTRAVSIAELPDGPDKALLRRTCGAPCHGLETAVGFRRDRTAWESVVENMVARGARASRAEKQRIVDYLAAHAGK